MKCHSARILITMQASQPLTPEQTESLQRHLAGCAACQTECAAMPPFMMQLREVGAAQAAYGVDSVRPDTGAILARVSRQAKAPKIPVWAMPAGLAGVAIVAATLALSRHTGTERRTPVAAKSTTEPPQKFAQTGTQRTNAKPTPTVAPTVQPQDAAKSLANAYWKAKTRRLRIRTSLSPLQVPALQSSDPAKTTAVALRVAPQDDLAYMNGDVFASVAAGSRWTSVKLRGMEAELQRSVLGGDDFVSIPLPAIAGSDERAIQAAAQAYEKERAVIDTRLVRRVSLSVKGVALGDLCRQLTRETGIVLRANRSVSEDKITVFCRERPLRDIMRQISSLLGFTWLRSQPDGPFEYQITQSMRLQLLEEGLRNKDRDTMLLELDRQMQAYRPYLGQPMARLQEQAKALESRLQDKAVFAEYGRLTGLQNGGLVAANMFYALSQAELDRLKGGETLSWDLRQSDALGLSPALLAGITDTFARMSPLPEGAKRLSDKLTATLKLDRSKPGIYTLKAGLYRDDGGMETALGEAKSPAKEKLDNAKINAKRAHDPTLQPRLTMKVKPTCTFTRPPYPDTEGLFEDSHGNALEGPQTTVADVLEALHKATGQDVIGDQFLRIYKPQDVSFENKSRFDALNQVGDAMQMHWSKGDGWLQFRSADFYYARLQEVPNRLLERWAESRRRNRFLPLESLTEIGELTDAQLDSIPVAQTAIACYGLAEWPVAQVPEGRPHWRLLADMARPQREQAFSAEGVSYAALTPAQQKQFAALARCEEVGVWPNGDAMRDARLQVRYDPRNNVENRKSPLANLIPPGNTTLFLYSFGQPKRYSAAGPFNGTYGLFEEMYQNRLHPKPPPDAR